MKKFKQYLHHIASPPKFLAIILGTLYITFVVAVFALDLEGTPVSYAAYLLSAYGLYLLVMNLLVPFGRLLIRIARRIPFIDRCFTDPAFRMRVFLYFGTAVNVIYALLKLRTGVRLESAWFISIAIYYIALSTIRFVVIRNEVWSLRQGSRDTDREHRTCRTVGILLVLLGLTLSGMITQVVRDGRSYSYSGNVIFAVATYAFYRIIAAAVRIFRKSAMQNETAFAVKIIDFCVAIVAMYTLQTALLSTYGTPEDTFIPLLNAVTGLVSVVLIVCGGFLLIRRKPG